MDPFAMLGAGGFSPAATATAQGGAADNRASGYGNAGISLATGSATAGAAGGASGVGANGLLMAAGGALVAWLLFSRR